MGEKPIFTCKAHVFHIDQKTRKSWIPASKDAVDVSFFYDAGRNLYRILSTDKNQCIINSTITPTMNFTKTSQKFGQWTDTIANTVYGVGFASEAHMEEFVSQFETSKSFVANSNTSPATSSAKNVNTSTLEKPKPPAISASPVSNRNSTGPSLSETNAKEIPQENGNSIAATKNVSVTSNESPLHKNHVSEKSTTEEYSSDMEQKYEILKLENDKLRKALAFSAVNAKKWEHELTTVKNHNARLTSALQESTSNVEEWKKQLQILKEENARFKKSQVDGHVLHENYGTLQKDTHLRSDEQKQLIMKFEEDKLRLQSAIKLHLQDKESMRESYQMNQKQLISLEQQISQKMNDLNLLFRDMRAVLSHDMAANK